MTCGSKINAEQSSDEVEFIQFPFLVSLAALALTYDTAHANAPSFLESITVEL